jgi:glycine/D-amino acid oxidase-like deaminating enzyme
MASGSLWANTAREHADFPALSSDGEADVAVIGGGILGLSTALALAQAGQRAVVLEAAEIGAGASGRNGGLVVPSLPRVGPDEVLSRMGDERGAAFIRLVLSAPAEVATLIVRFSIDCGFTQNGWLNPAHGPAMVAGLERRLAAWQRFGSPATLLSRAEAQQRIGSASYHGAIADPTGGHLNPLAYTRGLARAAAASGAGVHEHSAVASVQRQGDRWRLSTASGSLLADRVVQATNAQPPGVTGSEAASRGTVPLTVYELATEMLPPSVRAGILPLDEAMSDTRNNLFACCIDDTGRIVTGGMAPLTQLGATHWLQPFLARRLARLFPQLGEVRFDYVWSGRASLTADFLPRLFQPGPDWYVPFTCNGRGVALSTATGTRLGAWLASGDAGALPLIPVPPAPIRLHQIASRIPQWLLPLGMLADSRNERRPG